MRRRWVNPLARRRDASGTVAVIVALSCVMLFSFAAVAVDLTNAMARKRAVQSQADFASFAAVAGGANLPAASTSPLATDQAVIAAAEYLNKNQPQNDGAGSCVVNQNCVTPAQLVNGSTPDGEVYYGHFINGGATLVPNVNEITVLAPQAHVDFGLAGVMGYTGDEVQAKATVAIKSVKIPVLPFYAYTGCDYGPQTISEPNNGHAATTVNLFAPSDTNAATLTSLSPTSAAPNSATTTLTITGTNLSNVTMVGFFESGNSSAGPNPETSSPTTTAVPASKTNTQITITAPTSVTAVQNVWYVRVKIGGSWSAVTTGNGNNTTLMALPFTIGNALLTCGQGSNDGNFGTLKFQSTGQWQDTAKNIAVGLDHNLAPFPSAISNWLCSATTPLPVRSVLWPSEGTNCVDTETGMAQDAATKGFVTGLHSGGWDFNGLLTKTDNGTGCSSNGVPATTTRLGYTINNDTLSCFFTSTTTNVGQITSSTCCQSGPVLDPKIWLSPRLVFVPVLGVEPNSGGSNKYQILAFRPGFITDQTETATQSTPPTSWNGLTPSSNNNDVQSVQLVFFNPAALPNPPGGQSVQDYVPGAGPKIVRLVD